MKKIGLFYLYFITSLLGYAQDSTMNKVCDDFTQIYSDTILHQQLFEAYYTNVLLPTKSFSKENQEVFLTKLDSICPAINEFRKKMSASKAQPIDENEEFNNFLKAKASKPWTKEEIDSTVSRCSLNSKMNDDFENLCELSTQELSKHIDFEYYNLFSEYQQGLLMGKVATYIVESNKIQRKKE